MITVYTIEIPMLKNVSNVTKKITNTMESTLKENVDLVETVKN